MTCIITALAAESYRGKRLPAGLIPTGVLAVLIVHEYGACRPNCERPQGVMNLHTLLAANGKVAERIHTHSALDPSLGPCYTDSSPL